MQLRSVLALLLLSHAAAASRLPQKDAVRTGVVPRLRSDTARRSSNQCVEAHELRPFLSAPPVGLTPSASLITAPV